MNRRFFLTSLAIAPAITTSLMANSDIYLSGDDYSTLIKLKNRLNRLQRYVGFANFNILSYHDTLFYGRNNSKIGAFTKKEIALMERFFYEDPAPYGFYGSVTCESISNKVAKKEVKKIPYTGHYIFKGKPLKDYENLKKDVGGSLVLTSGVRNVIKQLTLYTNKIYRCGGNMTKASLSIAPPAYSYHIISDFDVGKKGWGYKNFTSAFAQTKEFRAMKKLKYIGMRYEKNNSDGVRFEPWHIEVI